MINFFVFMLFTATTGLLASSKFHLCESSERKRRIEVQHADGPARVPCSVKYYKDTEDPGNVRVLWTAQSDAEFCNTKGVELVGKLQAGGWACSQQNNPGQNPTAVKQQAELKKKEIRADGKAVLEKAKSKLDQKQKEASAKLKGHSEKSKSELKQKQKEASAKLKGQSEKSKSELNQKQKEASAKLKGQSEKSKSELSQKEKEVSANLKARSDRSKRSMGKDKEDVSADFKARADKSKNAAEKKAQGIKPVHGLQKKGSTGHHHGHEH